MAFYDVKNAMLMERRSTETVVQREPIVDMVKFTAFCEVANGIYGFRVDFGREIGCQRGQNSPKGGRAGMETESGPSRL